MKEEIDEYHLNPKFNLSEYTEIILNVVKSCIGLRNYYISSFHPDVCLLTKDEHPTMFLTTGTKEYSDERCISIENAIKFSVKNNMIGIVSDSAPLLQNLTYITLIKNHGLKCVSYGYFNNEYESCKRQIDSGIDAIILDNTKLALEF